MIVSKALFCAKNKKKSEKCLICICILSDFSAIMISSSKRIRSDYNRIKDEE